MTQKSNWLNYLLHYNSCYKSKASTTTPHIFCIYTKHETCCGLPTVYRYLLTASSYLGQFHAATAPGSSRVYTLSKIQVKAECRQLHVNKSDLELLEGTFLLFRWKLAASLPLKRLIIQVVIPYTM